MTLTNRLTLFFLVALAVVLAAFSVTLYALALAHLGQQVDERGEASLDALVAAAELEPDGLEWDRGEHMLSPATGGEPTVWAVFDSLGQAVDGDVEHVRRLAGYASPWTDKPHSWRTATWDGKPWRVFRRATSHTRSDIRERKAQPGVARIPGDERYQTLVFVVAAPLEPMDTALRALAWGLAGVSVAVWVIAAISSRWMCRRALTPLNKMSGAVKEISTDDLGGRLPVPATRDELADLAVAFNELLARLQEAFERQRRFTGEASHQLRTPLTAMLGQMEVALRRDRDTDEYRRVLTTAVAQAGRLRQIVEALLFLARADADAQLQGLEVVDLVVWLPSHVADAWSGHLRFGDLQLERQENVTLPVVAQPTLLGQAVDNLIDNAFKYSRPGSPVHVQLRNEEDWAVIAVKDEGPGIAAADASRVFDPFYRSDEVRERGTAGIGLGLAVTARIVTSLGGTVGIDAALARGSRFVIRLPIEKGLSVPSAPEL